MDLTTLLIIVVILLLLGGGGWYAEDAGIKRTVYTHHWVDERSGWKRCRHSEALRGPSIPLSIRNEQSNHVGLLRRADGLCMSGWSNGTIATRSGLS